MSSCCEHWQPWRPCLLSKGRVVTSAFKKTPLVPTQEQITPTVGHSSHGK